MTRPGNPRWRITLTGAVTLLIAVPLAVTPASAASAPPDRHVIMFDLDGLDPRLLEGAYADLAELPNIRALMDEGAYGVAAGSFSSYSNSSRATTATGTHPDMHRNTGYFLDPETGRGVTQNRYIEPGVETIAQSLSRQDRTAAYLQWYMVQNYGATYGDPEALYTQPGGGCEARADQAVALLAGEPVNSGGTMVQLDGIPGLMVVYCSDIDGVLHSGGYAHPDLPATLANVDAQVGRVKEAARQAGILDRTTFILTSDHGVREWIVPLLPEVRDRLDSTGFRVEVVASTGGVPDPESEIVIVSAPRTADITLRGRAAHPRHANRIERLIEQIPGIAEVYDSRDLRRIHASDKLGDLVVEPAEPYHLSTLTDGQRRGSHGGLAEAQVPLLVAGAGIEPDARLDHAGLVDVAAIVSALLGVEPPSGSQGRVPPRLIEHDRPGDRPEAVRAVPRDLGG